MRRWLKEEQKFKEWQNLEVQWVQHHDPILHLVDENGQEKDKIDLTKFSYGQIGEMLRQKGFRLKSEM